MKKIILTGIALMGFAAAGFAQNSATLNQVGSYQTSNQTQNGDKLKSTVTQGSGLDITVNTFNKSITDQSGKSQTATVLQDANSDYNRAGITQTDGGSASTDGNTATITQQMNSGGTATRSGTFGKDATVGKGNWAGILQNNQSNAASISQSNTSSSNFGEIYQTGSSNNANGNNLLIPAGARGNTSGGATIIIQDNNSSGNAALLTQGSRNDAQIIQSDQSFRNEAKVDQTNDGNAAIGQSNNSSDNTAYIKQVSAGDYSSASIAQYYGATNNDAKVYQYGRYGISSIEQASTSDHNKAAINQGGDVNGSTTSTDNERAYIHQDGGVYNSEATINQNLLVSGSGNKAQIDQTVAVKNTAIINQEGSRNLAGLYQTGGTNGNGDANSAMINQSGDGNVVKGPRVLNQQSENYDGVRDSNGAQIGFAFQSGQHNQMNVTQDSRVAAGVFNNTADLSQVGSENKITLNQTANSAGNTSTISQNGINNVAMTTQVGTAN